MYKLGSSTAQVPKFHVIGVRGDKHSLRPCQIDIIDGFRALSRCILSCGNAPHTDSIILGG